LFKTTLTAIALVLAATTANAAITEIAFATGDGSLVVTGSINRSITGPFIVDTGATATQIPADLYTALFNKGAVDLFDKTELCHVSLANGSEIEEYGFIIRQLEVGDVVAKNVRACVSPAGTETLLGQTFLSRFTYTIDQQRHVLRLEHAPTPPAPVAAPQPSADPVTTAFAEGRADRQHWERWYTSLSEGDYKAGATYWASVRSVPAKAATGCYGPGYLGTLEQQTWAEGCVAAKQTLAPMDYRRTHEPAYKAGWNS
jgi:hypothetical protein